jgi:DNA-3-methyladenine glycosylase I
MSPERRCSWARRSELLAAYHDTEWGVPLHDSRKLFELLLLEGAQAGLSWEIVLAKRTGYRRAFDRFDPARMARYDAAKVCTLLADPGIVRNRLKVEGAIASARAYLELQAAGVDFARWVWSFVDGVPIRNAWRRPQQIPVSTPISDALAKELKRAGFRFVGSTTVYAFMQASGMVNDHLVSCFRYPAPTDAGRAKRSSSRGGSCQ